jgi:hypothetical protein
MYGTVDSGVRVSQQFASRIKTSAGFRGFSWSYYDEIDEAVLTCGSGLSYIAGGDPPSYTPDGAVTDDPSIGD